MKEIKVLQQFTEKQNMKIVIFLILSSLMVFFVSAVNSSPSIPEKGFVSFPQEIEMIELTNSVNTESHVGTSTSYTTPATGEAGTVKVTATADSVSNEEAFLALINAFRAESQTCAGQAMPAVPPVSLNTSLNTASQLHSQDMADNNYFSHTGLNGSTFTTRAADQGYAGFAAGENISAGTAMTVGAFNQWRNSTAGHCQFMMSAAIDEIGIGYGHNGNSDFTHYWTLKGGKKS